MKILEKMRGGGQSPPRVGMTEVFWSWLGSFLGVTAVALGAAVMLLVALIVNNIAKNRNYPEFCW